MARGYTVVTASLTAPNTFSDWLYIMDNESEFLSFSATGIVGATIVTVQRSFDNGGTWVDVEAFAIADSVNGSVQRVVESFEQVESYRAGIKTGEYDSGTVVIRLSH